MQPSLFKKLSFVIALQCKTAAQCQSFLHCVFSNYFSQVWRLCARGFPPSCQAVRILPANIAMNKYIQNQRSAIFGQMNIGKEYGFFLQVIMFWEININIRKEDILKPAYFYRPLIWVLCLDCEDVQLDLSTQGHHTLAYNLQQRHHAFM